MYMLYVCWIDFSIEMDSYVLNASAYIRWYIFLTINAILLYYKYNTCVYIRFGFYTIDFTQ